MEKILTVKLHDMEIGRLEVTLNDEDARDLGLYSKDRVKIFLDGRGIVAFLNTTKTIVKKGEIGISRDFLTVSKIQDGEKVSVVPAERPRSVDYIRKKMKGIALTESEYEAIVKDVIANNLSEIELAAFVSAIYINEMSIEEAAFLAKKMAESGEMLELKKKPIFDKHSIGGVPGNKITLLVVPIVAAAGLTIPKTSSRAITSACGTADIMEVLAPVTFDAREIEEIVNKTNGVIAWGGGVNLAPADDIFIQVEYPLAIDPHYLALCSVMAKKYAVRANFVVIDLPMGEETKIGSMEEAKKYARDFMELGERLGINVECAITYGDKPIGRAVGPALEAREALRALEGGENKVPSSVIEKSTEIAGIILEAGGVAARGRGKEVALEYLSSGKALQKMKEITAEQGGDARVTSNDIRVGKFSEKIISNGSGYVTHISNRAIIQISRAAGAPKDKEAGILLNVTRGTKVERGDVLFEIYSDSEYKLEQALKLAAHMQPVVLEGMLLKRIPEYVIFEY
ncbi:MAG: AMP phosphorylase [Euryarchaeota archaeon]|nr:AMP phosphorylase [Euryarchaeota archaeon]